MANVQAPYEVESSTYSRNGKYKSAAEINIMRDQPFYGELSRIILLVQLAMYDR